MNFKIHIYKKQLIVAAIFAVLLLPSAVLAVLFYPANVTELEQKKTVVRVNDTIAVIEDFVDRDNSQIVTVQCHDKIHAVFFFDVISSKEWKEKPLEIFDIDGKYWTMDLISPDDKNIRYNDRFLWLQAFNGRYVIIDLVNVNVFITPSYYQWTLIILMTVSAVTIGITVLIYKKRTETAVL